MSVIDYEVFGPPENSRYSNSPEADYTDRSGRTVRYLRRRLLPSADAAPVLSEVTIAETDRHDMLAARLLSDPEQYWRLWDANSVMHPEELLRPAGKRIRVPGPQPEEPF